MVFDLSGCLISIHALREEGDPGIRGRPKLWGNFYPRPPRGGRPSSRIARSDQFYFYPRPPRGGRRLPPLPPGGSSRFLSTPSARRATHANVSALEPHQISIHALREEGDEGAARSGAEDDISIHALREEGDSITVPSEVLGGEFLSTPSARRATACSRSRAGPARHFYPRPPRGGRRPHHRGRRPREAISIHALREEGDSKNRDKISIFKQIIQHSARI